MRWPRARSSRGAGAGCGPGRGQAGSAHAARAGCRRFPSRGARREGRWTRRRCHLLAPLGLTGPGPRRYALTPMSGRSAAVRQRPSRRLEETRERDRRDVRERAGRRPADRGVPGADAHDVRQVRGRVAATSTRCTTTTRSRRRSATRRCSATGCSRWASRHASSRTGSGRRRSAGCKSASPSRCGRATCSRAPWSSPASAKRAASTSSTSTLTVANQDGVAVGRGRGDRRGR